MLIHVRMRDEIQKLWSEKDLDYGILEPEYHQQLRARTSTTRAQAAAFASVCAKSGT